MPYSPVPVSSQHHAPSGRPIAIHARRKLVPLWLLAFQHFKTESAPRFGRKLCRSVLCSNRETQFKIVALQLVNAQGGVSLFGSLRELHVNRFRLLAGVNDEVAPVGGNLFFHGEFLSLNDEPGILDGFLPYL